jgi:hypothetical protein
MRTLVEPQPSSRLIHCWGEVRLNQIDRKAFLYRRGEGP